MSDEKVELSYGAGANPPVKGTLDFHTLAKQGPESQLKETYNACTVIESI